MSGEKLTIGKYRIAVSNLDKVLFPKLTLTKGDLIDYYRKIADTMVDHIKDRPITMQRFPDGIEDKEFYQKEVPDYFPGWVKQRSVRVKEEKATQFQVVCNNAATLVYIANQACITPHIWLSRAPKLSYPDKMIFDLDPSGTDFEPVRAAAQRLRCFLEELGNTVYVMTTGSKGVHVVCPLDRRARFDTVRAFAQRVSKLLAEQYPDCVTTEHRKNKRHGRIFIDYLRNAYAQTSVAPYAVRALENAPVATPVTWQELADTKTKPQTYTIKNIFRRLAQTEDPWKGMMRHAISLRTVQQKLDHYVTHTG